MLNTPFSPWPSYTQEEVDAVAQTLASNRVNYWTGDRCREFERRFADWAGTKHAVALANGTLALDLALKALGIGPGDEVVTMPPSPPVVMILSWQNDQAPTWPNEPTERPR